ncbi:hypothetical protein [Parenemella sanctibonifatiensis]|uniref:hypothetical protein n=1 Tax=Parenemella sanctibonifatiensis TaxID=2016505 RepID=UPI001184A979|nr:hypothetical protein [Parenemella sanctibonifatiensis]
MTAVPEPAPVATSIRIDRRKAQLRFKRKRSSHRTWGIIVLVGVAWWSLFLMAIAAGNFTPIGAGGYVPMGLALAGIAMTAGWTIAEHRDPAKLPERALDISEGGLIVHGRQGAWFVPWGFAEVTAMAARGGEMSLIVSGETMPRQLYPLDCLDRRPQEIDRAIRSASHGRQSLRWAGS